MKDGWLSWLSVGKNCLATYHHSKLCWPDLTHTDTTHNTTDIPADQNSTAKIISNNNIQQNIHSFNDLTLLIVQQKGHPACKKLLFYQLFPKVYLLVTSLTCSNCRKEDQLTEKPKVVLTSMPLTATISLSNWTEIGSESKGGNEIEDFSRTFKHPRNLFPNLFHCSFQHKTQLLQHQVSNWYWLSLYLSSFSYDRIIFHIMGRFGIQALSRTSQAKFQNFFKHQIRFQGLSRALKSGNKISRTFKDSQGRVATLK